jgi:hypothetical protein
MVFTGEGLSSCSISANWAGVSWTQDFCFQLCHADSRGKASPVTIRQRLSFFLTSRAKSAKAERMSS